MRATVLVSSRPARALSLAEAWAAAGDAVTVVLCDESAAAARTGHVGNDGLARAQRAGVAVAAHDDALQRRGVEVAQLADGVKAVDLDEIADLVTEGGDRTVWL